MSGPLGPELYRYLDTNGDGTGSKNASVDGSITPVQFKIVPQNDDWIILERVLVLVEDNGNITSSNYGAIPTLANGVEVAIHNVADDSVDVDLLDGLTIRENVDWGRQCYDATFVTFGGGNNAVLVRWTFSKAGQPMLLKPDRYFAVTINDDLTGLANHNFHVQGYYRRKGIEYFS